MKTRKMASATKLKISLSQRGKKNSMYGKKHTVAALKRMQRANAGKNNPMHGRKHSAESIKKMILAIRRRRTLKKKR